MAKKIAWTEQARADVRAIDRETALHLLHGLPRFLATETGDVKRLHDHGESIEVLTVKHRKDAYR